MRRQKQLIGRRRPGQILWVAVVAGLLLGVAVVASAAPDPLTEAAQGLPMKACAAFKAKEAAAESQELFDPATGKLVVTTGDSTFVLDENDASCRSNVLTKQRLENARAMDKENVAALCQSFRQAIAENRKEEKGRTVNLAAATKYVADTCPKD